MKKFILTIFICILSAFYYGYGQIYQTTYSSDPASNNRIGYTTQYGYGFRQNQTPITYYPIGATQPKRITVYNGDGETGQTPGGENDSEDWLYMQDEEGNWYCSKDNGITWYLWTQKTYGGPFGWLAQLIDELSGNTESWTTYSVTPPENTTKWASDPDDPFLDPIGDVPAIALIAFLCIYLFYKKKKL